MKPLRDIIVRVDKAYRDKILLRGGKYLYLNQVLKQVGDTLRYGTVIAVPESMDVDIKEGDVLFFHHGIVAETEMGDKENILSPYLVDAEEHLYYVPIDKKWPLAYAILRDGIFSCLEGICFIKPCFKVEKGTSHIIAPRIQKETQNIGELKFLSPKQKSEGLMEGDKVIFENDSEYQFELNGEILYCMFDKWILAKVNCN